MRLYTLWGNTVQVPYAEILPAGLFAREGCVGTLCAMPFSAHVRPIHAVRWRNFRALIEGLEMGVTAAAAKLEKTQPQVSQFGGSNPTKMIGDDLAAQIEECFGLPLGALDVNDSGDELVSERPGGARSGSQIGEPDEAILTEVEKWVRFEEGAGPRYQPVRRLQRSIQILQLMQANGGRIPQELALQLIDAKRGQQGTVTNGKPARQRGDSK